MLSYIVVGRPTQHIHKEPVMKIDIYGDGIGYVTDEVSSVPTYKANYSQTNREKFVTDLAAISRGKHESKNPSIRFKSLLTEAACNTPSRPMEFLPVILTYRVVPDASGYTIEIQLKDDKIKTMRFEVFNNTLGKFSYIEPPYIYTNLRAVINAGIAYEDVPYNTSEKDLERMKQFKALRANVSMFVWAQVPNTHTQISKEAQSDRVTGSYYYWLPTDLGQRIREAPEDIKNISHFKKQCYTHTTDEFIPNSFVHYMLNVYNQDEVQQLLKDLGYKREIWSRAPYYLKYKECVMTGWYNDPHVWQHLFLERGAKPNIWKNWTQGPTELFVKAICAVVEGSEK